MSSPAVSRRRLLAAAAALPLAGCVAMPYGTYFRPATDAPGARLRRAWCQGNAGPQTQLELEVGPVHLAARMERDYLERQRPDWPLRLELRLPRARPLRFLGDAVALRTLSGGRALAAETQVRAIGSALRPADAEVDPVAWRPAGGAGRSTEPGAPHGWATLALSPDAALRATAFVVEPPAVQLGPRRLAAPRPLLRLAVPQADSGAYLSEAQAQALRGRSDACRSEPEGTRCRDVLRHARWSFESADELLAWRGEWSHFRGAVNRASVALAPQTAAPWRLERPLVQLRSEAGAVLAELPVREIALLSRDTVALSAPLHGHRVPGAGDTRLALELSLPDDVPDFELQLPPLMLDAQRLDLPPLRFERRRFDGGIEPFNC